MQEKTLLPEETRRSLAALFRKYGMVLVLHARRNAIELRARIGTDTRHVTTYGRFCKMSTKEQGELLSSIRDSFDY